MRDDIEAAINKVFIIERSNLPRSNFAGIRNPNAIVKRSNNLRNNAWRKKVIDDDTIQLTIDLNIAPYAKYINEESKFITKGYFDKIAYDAYVRLKNELGGE